MDSRPGLSEVARRCTISSHDPNLGTQYHGKTSTNQSCDMRKASTISCRIDLTLFTEPSYALVETSTGSSQFAHSYNARDVTAGTCIFAPVSHLTEVSSSSSHNAHYAEVCPHRPQAHGKNCIQAESNTSRPGQKGGWFGGEGPKDAAEGEVWTNEKDSLRGIGGHPMESGVQRRPQNSRSSPYKDDDRSQSWTNLGTSTRSQHETDTTHAAGSTASHTGAPSVFGTYSRNKRPAICMSHSTSAGTVSSGSRPKRIRLVPHQSDGAESA